MKIFKTFKILCAPQLLHLVFTLATISETLCILVAPHVELNLGPAVNPRDLEEGDDVYFECHIKSHPSAYKVTWKHNVSWWWIFHIDLFPSLKNGRNTSKFISWTSVWVSTNLFRIQFVNGFFRVLRSTHVQAMEK